MMPSCVDSVRMIVCYAVHVCSRTRMSDVCSDGDGDHRSRIDVSINEDEAKRTASTRAVQRSGRATRIAAICSAPLLATGTEPVASNGVEALLDLQLTVESEHDGQIPSITACL